MGSRSAVVAELLVGDAGERREREEKVRVTETRGWVPLGAAEAGEMREEDGMAEAEAEGQGRQVRRAGRRRRMLVFEGLGADGGNEQRVDGQDTVVVESDTRVEAPRTSAVQEADVWSAMRGVEIEI